MKVRSFRRLAGFAATAIIAALSLGATALNPSPAWALPSFARQTGQGCPACHTNFPELTPFGRQFKLNGYTLSNGESKIPPFAAMVQTGFTNTRTAQPGEAAPGFGANDNFSLEAASLFYGGKVVDNLGAFIQATYSDTSKTMSWDNTDIRYANTANVFDHDLTFGLNFNNNPTVSDIYNTTPAFNFPFAGPSLAPSPAAATLIEGGLAQQVGGLGAYGMLDDTLYAEVSVYKTLWRSMQRSFGVNTGSEAEIDGGAPYWRLALQHQWGDHFAEIGTFGLYANTFPARIHDFGDDKFVDTGIDATYQYILEHHIFGFYGSWIHEDQTFGASQQLGATANPSDTLNSLRLRGSYTYARDWSKYGFTVQYFSINGSTDTGLYAPGALTGSNNGSPNSRGWIFELDYLPFINRDTIPFWPWAQVKLSLQYTLYNKFNGAGTNYDGAGRNASDNNTLFLLAWFAF
jgi:hypothetical protein